MTGCRTSGRAALIVLMGTAVGWTEAGGSPVDHSAGQFLLTLSDEVGKRAAKTIGILAVVEDAIVVETCDQIG